MLALKTNNGSRVKRQQLSQRAHSMRQQKLALESKKQGRLTRRRQSRKPLRLAGRTKGGHDAELEVTSHSDDEDEIDHSRHK